MYITWMFTVFQHVQSQLQHAHLRSEVNGPVHLFRSPMWSKKPLPTCWLTHWLLQMTKRCLGWLKIGWGKSMSAGPIEIEQGISRNSIPANFQEHDTSQTSLKRANSRTMLPMETYGIIAVNTRRSSEMCIWFPSHRPEDTNNPSLARFYDFLGKRAVEPGRWADAANRRSMKNSMRLEKL